MVVWTLVSAVQDGGRAQGRDHHADQVALRRPYASSSTSSPGPSRSFESRDRVAVAVCADGAWSPCRDCGSCVVLAGFTSIFWGTGVDPLSEAFATSGSSLFTLGFIAPARHGADRAGVRRGRHRARPDLADDLVPADDLRRIQPPRGAGRDARGARRAAAEPGRAADPLPRIGWLDRIDDDLFERWEPWFVDVEESHTSQPSLVFFRSPHPERSWITAAGCVLDTAAIVSSTHRSAVQRHAATS